MEKGIFMLASTYGLNSIFSFFLLYTLSVSSASPVNSSQIPIPGVSPPTSPTPLQVKYPSITTPTLSRTDEAYSFLPVCPATPTNCPDINGKGSVQDCPSSCTVTRSVTQIPIGETTKITTSDAICPVGYTAVASYNAALEITNQPAPGPAPIPIPDMQTYNIYINNHYSCGKQTPQTPRTTGNCTPGSIPPPLNTVMLIIVPNVVGEYTNHDIPVSHCYTDSSCTQKPVAGGCAYNYAMSTYELEECTPPTGLFYTANMVPTSVVCSYLQPIWVSLPLK